MKKIRWAIVGAGGIADKRAIPGLLGDETNEIVAIMDKNPEVAKRIAEKYGVQNFFDDMDKMFTAVKCDAVYIATPVFCHYEQAMTALKYGCNAFIEKPLAMNADESEAIVHAFQKAKVQLTVGYMMGYHNLHKKAKSIVKRGGIGQVVSARFQFFCWSGDFPGGWRHTKALGGGGCVMDLAVHCMELYSQITGDSIKDVKSFYDTLTFQYEVEDSASILFRTEKGVIGHVDVNFNVPDEASTSKMELYGTEGSLVAEGTIGQLEVGKLKFIHVPEVTLDRPRVPQTVKPKISYGQKKNMYTKQFAAFDKLLLAGKTSYKNAKKSVEIQRLCDRIYADN